MELVPAKSMEGFGQTNGPWYVTRYRVSDASEAGVVWLGQIDWADWDKNGAMLFGQNGCLYRQSFENLAPCPPDCWPISAGTSFHPSRHPIGPKPFE